MYFTFKKSNKQTKKPINRFLQDGTSAGIRSLQTSIEIKLSKVHGTDFNDFCIMICEDLKIFMKRKLKLKVA